MYTFNFRPISSGGFGFGPCTKAYWVLLCFCQHFVHIHDGAYIDEPRNYSRGAIVQQHLRIFKTLKWPVNWCSVIWFGIIHHAACNREKWSWKFEGLFWDHHGSLYTIRWCKMRCIFWLFCHFGSARIVCTKYCIYVYTYVLCYIFLYCTVLLCFHSDTYHILNMFVMLVLYCCWNV